MSFDAYGTKLQEPKRSIIFIGNPGAGKSTLLNTFAGRPLFNSGVSIGKGLTTKIQILECVDGKNHLIDTPGLADLVRKQSATSEITKAFSISQKFKLVFVITVEAGKIRSADIAAIYSVMSALRDAGIDMTNKYGIVVNKLNRKLIEQFQKYSWLNRFSNDFDLTTYTLYVPFEPHAFDQDGEILSCREKLYNWVDDLATVNMDDHCRFINVNEDSFFNFLDEISAPDRNVPQQPSFRTMDHGNHSDENRHISAVRPGENVSFSDDAGNFNLQDGVVQNTLSCSLERLHTHFLNLSNAEKRSNTQTHRCKK